MGGEVSVAMIGEGNVGSALAEGLERAGYDVETVGNEPKRVKQVAKNGDVVFLAIPAGEYENALATMGDAIKGKVLVDVANVISDSFEFDGNLKESHAEALQKAAKNAKVVKAFNTVFAQHLSTGHINGENLTMFVAGDDEAAKETVMQLARDIGFDAVDAGPLNNSRWLETLGWWNISLGHKLNMGQDIGFKLVRGAPATESTHRAVSSAVRR